jgi:hypothetical protein
MKDSVAVDDVLNMQFWQDGVRQYPVLFQGFMFISPGFTWGSTRYFDTRYSDNGIWI